MANAAETVGNYSGRPQFSLQAYAVRIETDVANNRSRYRCELYANNPTLDNNGTWTGGAAPWGFNLGGQVNSGSAALDFRGAPARITLAFYETGWFGHDANGNLTLVLDANHGPLDVFGTADPPVVNFVTDRIDKLPSAPSGLALVLSSLNTITASWNAANAYGGAILEYELQHDDGSNFSGATVVSAGTSLSKAVTGLPYNARRYFRVRARTARGWGGWSATAYKTTTSNLPPAASTPGVARVSDTQQTVSWNRTASASSPVDSQQVLRRIRATSWGSYANVNSIDTGYTSNGSHSWADTGTVPNRMYQYQIKTVNPQGERLSTASVFVYTTPAAPTELTAVKNAASGIDLTLEQGVLHGSYQTTLQYSTDGGTTWLALATLSAGVLSYTMASPPGGSAIKFRARVAIVDSGAVGNGLTSSWKESSTVQLTAPPNPPSALNPNGVTFDAVGARTFSWQHNSVDSSLQSAYEIQYRIGTGAYTSTGKITSTTRSRVMPANLFSNGQSYNWQVRTWGVHANPSGWSTSATFTTSAVPTVSISSPGSVLNMSQVTATWVYADAEGSAQSGWEANLVAVEAQGGDVLQAKSGSGTATSVLFTTRLEDNTSYKIQVRVKDGSGLWSAWDQQTFTTDFLLPPVPLLTATFSDVEGVVTLNIENPPAVPGVTAEATSNRILRSNNEGASWNEFLADAPLNGTVLDPTVPLSQTVLYRVEAWSDLPSSAVSADASVYSLTNMGYWSAGPGFQNTTQLRVGLGSPPRIDITRGLADKTLHYFAGRTLPVEATGTSLERTGTVEFLVSSLAERQLVAAMSFLPAPHLFRLPDGTYFFASIGAVSEVRVDRDAYTFSFPVQEVDS